MNTQDKHFSDTYRALMEESFKEYRAPVFQHTVHYPNSSAVYDMNYATEIRRQLRITIMEEDYQRLMEDAEAGRDARFLRGQNPALLEAWDRYRMLLALTAVENP